MKKLLCILAILSILSLTAVVWAVQQDQRILLENRSQGNRSAGEVVAADPNYDEGFILAMNKTRGPVLGVLASSCNQNATWNATCAVITGGVGYVMLYHGWYNASGTYYPEGEDFNATAFNGTAFNSTTEPGNILFMGEAGGQVNGSERWPLADANKNATVATALESTNGTQKTVKALIQPVAR